MDSPQLWYAKKYIKHVEPIKIILKYKNINYYDFKINDKQYNKKELSKYYFNENIRYQDKNINLVDIPLIIDYLGYKYNLHGNNLEDIYKIKTVVNNCINFKNLLSFNNEYIYKYHIDRKSAIDNHPKIKGYHLYYINKLIEGPYVCGNNFTIADVCILSLTRDCLNIDINSLEHYYKINKLCLEIYNNIDTIKLYH